MALSTEQKAMVDKILKLMELGKDSNNGLSGEREAANAMAAKLMAKYSIDFADLRAGKSKDMFSRIDVDMNKQAPVNWEGSLALVISEAFDVKVVQRTKPWVLMYCGTKTDIEITVFFFQYLRRSVGMQANHKFSKKADRDTFAYAMVNEIGRRMKDLYDRRNASFDEAGSALMVIKNQGLSTFVQQQFPNLRRGRGVKLTGSYEAHRAGVEAGKKVNISRPLAGPNGGKTQIK